MTAVPEWQVALFNAPDLLMPNWRQFTCARECAILASLRSWLVRLSLIHDQEQELALKTVSGTLEASEYAAKTNAGEFQTPFSIRQIFETMSGQLDREN